MAAVVSCRARGNDSSRCRCTCQVHTRAAVRSFGASARVQVLDPATPKTPGMRGSAGQVLRAVHSAQRLPGLKEPPASTGNAGATNSGNAERRSSGATSMSSCSVESSTPISRTRTRVAGGG